MARQNQRPGRNEDYRRPVTAAWLREIAERSLWPDVAAYLERRAMELEASQCPHGCGLMVLEREGEKQVQHSVPDDCA